MRKVDDAREAQLLRPVKKAVEDAASNKKISVPESRGIAQKADRMLARSDAPHRQRERLLLAVDYSEASIHPKGDALLTKRTKRAANRRELLLQFRHYWRAEGPKYDDRQAGRLADLAMVAVAKGCAVLGLDPTLATFRLEDERGWPPGDGSKGMRDFRVRVSGPQSLASKGPGSRAPNYVDVHVKTDLLTGKDDIVAHKGWY